MKLNTVRTKMYGLYIAKLELAVSNKTLRIVLLSLSMSRQATSSCKSSNKQRKSILNTPLVVFASIQRLPTV